MLLTWFILRLAFERGAIADFDLWASCALEFAQEAV